MSFLVRRTRDRRPELQLRAEHEDRGPYFLVDRAGFGVSWRSPASEIRYSREQHPSRYAGVSHTRRSTWIPVFERARLAFALVDEDETMTPKEAKALADRTYEVLTRRNQHPSTAEAERFAWHLREKKQRDRGRDRRRGLR